MSGAVKEILTLTGTLVLAFLVLTHFTGFSRDVGAVGSGYVGVVKALQGR